MTNFSALYRDLLANDDILYPYAPLLAPSAPDIKTWALQTLSTAAGDTRNDLTAVVSYVLDMYTTACFSHGLAHCLDELTEVATCIAQDQSLRKLETSASVLMSDAILTSVRMIRTGFLAYRDHLRKRFDACFLMGSASYGRFHSTCSIGHRSDFNMFLVVGEQSICIDDILVDGVVNDIDDCRRLSFFDDPARGSSPTVFNYKLRHAEYGFVISLNIVSHDGLRHISTPNLGAFATLYWDRRTGATASVGFGGKPYIGHDLAGRPYNVPYRERESEFGFVLDIPVFIAEPGEQEKGLGAFNDFITMLLPRFDYIFIDEATHSSVRTFALQMTELERAYQEAGHLTKITNVHIRKSKFSPLVAAKADNLSPIQIIDRGLYAR